MSFIHNSAIPSLTTLQTYRPEFIRVSADALVVDDDFEITYGGAGQTAVVDSGSYFSGTTVEAVLQELGLRLKILTSISSAPAFVGQQAVVSSIAYIATGTASINDWKQITG